LIKRSAIRRCVKPRKPSTLKTVKTLAGNIATAESVTLRDARLSEFDIEIRRIEKQKSFGI